MAYNRQARAPRPFVKWAGGKRQLLPALLEAAPKTFKKYHEPFVGGGALFFELRHKKLISKACISDTNNELITSYIALRDDAEGVIARLKTFRYDRNFFYELRKKNPLRMLPVNCAARLIYLNRTCFNGLYRVNRQGRFNVPFGRYKDPLICDEENLRAVAQALKGVEILCDSFESVLHRAKKGDFVYFDPPYVPVSQTSSFTAYQAGGFSHDDQQLLLDVFETLAGSGVFVMLSNSSTDLVRTLYSAWNIREVSAIRAINSKGNRRKGHKELIITNY